MESSEKMDPSKMDIFSSFSSLVMALKCRQTTWDAQSWMALVGGDKIDLSELASMLLIPTLVKTISSQRYTVDSEIVGVQPGLIQMVLSMILHDVTGSSEPPKLSISFLRNVLLAYGEEEMSNDHSLLEEMMNAAGTDRDDFNVDTFSRALTSDVMLYNVKDEGTLTTNYRDVMKATNTDKSSLKEKETESDEDYLIEDGIRASVQGVPSKIRKFPSSPAIDFTACRYSSKFIVVFLWTGFVISYIAYFGRFVRTQVDWLFDNQCSSQNFGCRIGVAILEWLFILATLCGFGLAYVAFGSVGNGIEDTKKWTRLFAFACVGAITWASFFALYRREDDVVGTISYFDEEGNPVNTQDIVIEESEPYEAVVYYISAIIGTIVMLLEIWMMLGETVRKRCFAKASSGVISFFTSTGVKAEAGNKHAAAVKMNNLVKNACQIHSYSPKDISHGETSFGAGLLNFSVHGDGEYEEVGGFIWTWTRLFNKTLSDEEGVWISARLMAGNFSQLLISAFLITYGVAFTRYIVDEWEKGKENPSRYLFLALDWFDVLDPIKELADSSCAVATDLANGILDVSQVLWLTVDNATCTTVAVNAINRTAESISNNLYPQERYMIEAPMIVATFVSFLTSLALVVVYLPSVASTTLQFRTGAIPFFRDGFNFDTYRSRLDQVTILLGSMFWSALYAAAFIGILIGIIVFLFLWQVTREIFIGLLAVLIGLVSTICIKILIAVFLLRTAYAAFLSEESESGQYCLACPRMHHDWICSRYCPCSSN